MTYQIVDIMDDLVFAGYGLVIKEKDKKDKLCVSVIDDTIILFKTKDEARKFYKERYGK